ncbi:hypothetical protein TKK_0010325 [Trichogramma kaykai]
MGSAREYDDDSIRRGIRKVYVPKKKFLEKMIDVYSRKDMTNARVQLIKQFDKELRNPKPTPLEFTKTLEHGIELLESSDIDYKSIRDIEHTTKDVLFNLWFGWRFMYIMMEEEILKRIEDETLRERMSRAINSWDDNFWVLQDQMFQRVLYRLWIYVMQNNPSGDIWDDTPYNNGYILKKFDNLYQRLSYFMDPTKEYR